MNSIVSIKCQKCGHTFKMDELQDSNCPNCGNQIFWVTVGLGEDWVTRAKKAEAELAAINGGAYSKREQDMLDRQKYIEGVMIEQRTRAEKAEAELATLSSTNSQERRACPRCGTPQSMFERWIEEDGATRTIRYRIMCTHCGYTPDDWQDTPQAAIEFWNTRFLEDSLRTRAEKAEAAYEGLADLEIQANVEHEIWRSWMEYQFSKGTLNENGTWTMPTWAVERWQHQMHTAYVDLSEAEKDLDREQVRKHLAAIGATQTTTNPALRDVLAECKRQEDIWGQQNHDPAIYLAILVEEIGEMAQAALQNRYGGDKGSPEHLREEAVHTAAVALSIVACLDRGLWRWPDQEIHRLQIERDSARRNCLNEVGRLSEEQTAHTTTMKNLAMAIKQAQAVEVDGDALAEIARWALDTVNSYDQRLVDLGDPPDLVNSEKHQKEKTYAMTVLAEHFSLKDKIKNASVC